MEHSLLVAGLFFPVRFAAMVPLHFGAIAFSGEVAFRFTEENALNQ
jgi:hypothetical protein